MQSDTGAIALPNLHHIGVVVKDVDKTTEFLSSTLGIGPWEIFDYSPSKGEMLVGEPFSLKIAHAKLGSVVLELLQPLEEGSIWEQFLETKGEGLQHIDFHLSNWEEIASKLQEQGSRMVVGAINQRGKRWAYFDTKPGGIIVELGES